MRGKSVTNTLCFLPLIGILIVLRKGMDVSIPAIALNGAWQGLWILKLIEFFN